MPMCGFIKQYAWYFVSLLVINTKSLCFFWGVGGGAGGQAGFGKELMVWNCIRKEPAFLGNQLCPVL